MKEALYKAVADRASQDQRLYVVVADLGSFAPFRDEYPDRFINVGVAEPNSVGVAAGLASEGNSVLLYGVAGFTLYRAFEQLKFNVGYWRQPVCLVSTGFSWHLHHIGAGHHANDDVALARLLPNFSIFTPYLAADVHRVITNGFSGPIYLRLNTGQNADQCSGLERIGHDLTVVALGNIAYRCTNALRCLEQMGYDVGLVPVTELSGETLTHLAHDLSIARSLVVIEDHVYVGGLAAWLVSLGVRVDRYLCLPEDVSRRAPTLNGLYKAYGFDDASLESLFLAAVTKGDAEA